MIEDHERIYLQPLDADDIDDSMGRMWAQDAVWDRSVEYVRADVAADLVAVALSHRDREWSAALETGFSQCPPLDPDGVSAWFERLYGRVEQSAAAAENERRDREDASDTPGLMIRQRIMDCDEATGADGHCSCSRWISAYFWRRYGSKLAALERQQSNGYDSARHGRLVPLRLPDDELPEEPDERTRSVIERLRFLEDRERMLTEELDETRKDMRWLASLGVPSAWSPEEIESPGFFEKVRWERLDAEKAKEERDAKS